MFKIFFAALLSWMLAATPVFASYNQSDLTNLNNAEPPSKYNRTFGYRHGAGKCVFDPSATSASRSTGAHTCGLKIPKSALVKFAAYKVLTTFTSATDAATIAISIVAANDVVTATAITSGTTWDAAGAIEGVPKVEDTSTWLTTTADSDVTFTVASEVLTAGKMVLWVEWLYYGDV